MDVVDAPIEQRRAWAGKGRLGLGDLVPMEPKEIEPIDKPIVRKFR